MPKTLTEFDRGYLIATAHAISYLVNQRDHPMYAGELASSAGFRDWHIKALDLDPGDATAVRQVLPKAKRRGSKP